MEHRVAMVLLTDLFASLIAQLVKNLPAVQKTRVRFLGWEDPLEKEMAAHSIFLPGESHGQRGLVGYTVHRAIRVRHDSVTKPPPPS